MPEVKDETGKVIANMPYDAAGKLAAKEMVEENPGFNITDARDRSGVSHAGDGSTGFDSIGVPMYKDGGKPESDKGWAGVEGGVFSEAGKKRRAERKKARQERRAARQAAKQAKRSKRVAEGKTPLTWKDEAVFGKDKHVYKKGEEGDVSYKKKGTKKEQQVHVTKDGKTTLKSEKTKGGDYAVYGKGSKQAKSYQAAYAEAKKSGQGTTFTWGGNKHVVKDAKPAKKKTPKTSVKDKKPGESKYTEEPDFVTDPGQSKYTEEPDFVKKKSKKKSKKVVKKDTKKKVEKKVEKKTPKLSLTDKEGKPFVDKNIDSGLDFHNKPYVINRQK